MRRSPISLPAWTARPVFGVLVLLVLAIVLIAHGEPQPSSRPSGTSVGVSGTANAGARVPPLLYLVGDRVEYLHAQVSRQIVLPSGAAPRAVVTGRGLSVVLASVDGRQRAFSVDKNLRVRDLGYADAALPAAAGRAAIIVETALSEPGELSPPTPAPDARGAASPSDSKSVSGQQALRDFSVRRYDAAGNPIGPVLLLPPGTQAAVDTLVGLTVWQPVNRVFDAGVEQESLSAAAFLIRPDNTERDLGPVHPLAADDRDLLVWDVVARRFGVMPLTYATSTATSTASPLSTAPEHSRSRSATRSPSPEPTAVAGVRWFLPTRGMLLVTGPGAFNAAGSAFAVYGQVGTRRRLVVAELQNLGTDQVQVLALAAPPARTSGDSSAGLTSGATSAAAASSGHRTQSGSNGTSTSPSASATGSETIPGLASDGYPIPAPLTPQWWSGMVVGLGTDGTVIGYQPGKSESALLDLGISGITALAATP